MPSVLNRLASSAAERDRETVRDKVSGRGRSARGKRIPGRAEENARTGYDRRRVQTRERDELDQEAGLAEVPNERLELLVGEAVRAPVERRRQVVDEPPARPKCGPGDCSVC